MPTATINGKLAIAIINQGRRGLKGEPGGGGGGGGALRYTHTQGSASTSWVVNHNLGVRPIIEVFTPGGLRVRAQIDHPSDNQAIVSTGTVPRTGTATCIG